MKNRILLISLLVIAASLLLSACTGTALATSWPGVTVQGEKAFLANTSHVYSINLTNGSINWKFPVKVDAKKSFYSAPALLDDGAVVVGDYGNFLHVIDASSGNERWSFEAKGKFVAPILVHEGMIFAPNGDHYLYALDAAGQMQWKYETSNPIWAGAVADGDKIFFASMDHILYAVDHRSGAKAWSTDLGAAVIGTPLLSEDGTLYVGTIGSELFSVNSETGRINWKYSAKDQIWSSPALVDTSLYFTDISGTVYALSTETQREIWTYTAESPVVNTPLIVGETLYLTTDKGSLVALDRSNAAVLFTRTIVEKDKLYASPVAAGDLILIPYNAKDVLMKALDTNGNDKWSVVPQK